MHDVQVEVEPLSSYKLLKLAEQLVCSMAQIQQEQDELYSKFVKAVQQVHEGGARYAGHSGTVLELQAVKVG